MLLKPVLQLTEVVHTSQLCHDNSLHLLRLQPDHAVIEYNICHAGPPRRAALGLYTEGLNTAKLLPQYGAQRLF